MRQQVIELLLASVAARGEYDQSDFTSRLDGLLDTLDGTSYGAQGGRYTDVAMRDVWRGRKVEGKPWGQVGHRGGNGMLRGCIFALLNSHLTCMGFRLKCQSMRRPAVAVFAAERAACNRGLGSFKLRAQHSVFMSQSRTGG